MYLSRDHKTSLIPFNVRPERPIEDRDAAVPFYGIQFALSLRPLDDLDASLPGPHIRAFIGDCLPVLNHGDSHFSPFPIRRYLADCQLPEFSWREIPPKSDSSSFVQHGIGS